MSLPVYAVSSTFSWLPFQINSVQINTGSFSFLQKWEYMHIPPKGTPEASLVEILKNPKDWL